MRVENFDYTVAILCGGKSTRMGQDKATMLLNDIRLVDRLIQEFAFCGEILLSVRNRLQAEEIANGISTQACRYVLDEIPDAGPLAGMAAALKKCRTEWLFITAVDMPLMDRIFAEELLLYAERASITGNAESAQGVSYENTIGRHYDAIVPLDARERPQMLSAFYRKSALSQMECCLTEGKRKVRSCLEGLRVCRVPTAGIQDAEKKLINVNDLKEWEDYKETVRMEQK